MIAALIVAAGRGERFGATLPKQYLELAGAPLVRHAVLAFARHPKVERIKVVIQPGDRERYERAVAGLALMPPVHGGVTRQESVRLGLEALVETGVDTVLIHDAARPFPSPALIDAVLRAIESAEGAVPALPVADTLKRAAEGIIQGTVDRAGLWRAQTPQGFRFPSILAAHRAARGEALTDDAAVAERAGLAVAVVPGEEGNLKITDASDMARAAAALGERGGLASPALADVRVGSGFDVHRFTAGDHVMLCGVCIPFDKGLSGHSDADVGLHALTDAILGALGAGDIGQHFPPEDPRWTGVASCRFLGHARDLVGAAGGEIAHVDVTLICERPKVGPHRHAMAARVAEILSLPASRVSLKATTTEHLGFLGRGEGIAALAVATLRLPTAT